MVRRIIQGVVIAVAVTLVCLLVGAILLTLHVEVAVTVGDWLKHWGGVLGVLAGLWWASSLGPWPPWRRSPS